jgi:glycosyltransferase involved in cell wall biosynthesis
MKPIILTFSSFYLPGFRGGGPIRTIANMVERLSDDFEFRIVTSDRDLGDSKPYPNIQVESWISVGKAMVFYTNNLSFLNFAKIMRTTSYDLLYLNSFFDPKFTLQPIIARVFNLKKPLILAPRGEFSKGALQIKSWKKKPFLLFARYSGLYADAVWHASTDAEAKDIDQNFLKTSERVRVARNISVAGDLLATPTQITNAEDSHHKTEERLLRVCFLSRISPMKNLDYALEILAKVQTKVFFEIYGPREDLIYWRKCDALIQALPHNIKANYLGPVDNSRVAEIIGMHDLFFVPSRGENFGHVFMESLSAGVPILVSDQTPWRDLEKQNLGWDIPLDKPDSFVAAIEKSATLNEQQRLDVRRNCINFSQAKAYDPFTVEDNRALFINALTVNH